MDRRFFRSKEFLIAAALAALAVAAGAYAAVNVFPKAVGSSGGPCHVDAPAGDALQAEVDDTGAQPADGHVERTITWRLDLDQRSLSTVDVCGNDGTLTVEATDGDQIRIQAHLVGEDERILDHERPRARFAQDGGELSLALDQPERNVVEDEERYERPTIRVEVQIPRGNAPVVDVRHDDGDLTVADVDASRLSVRLDDGDADLDEVSAGDLRVDLDDGDVVARQLEARGDAELHSDDGTIELGVASIASGDWRARTDDGTIGLRLPAADEIGYDAEARTDDGYSSIVLEDSGRKATADGGRAQARSAGFADRSIQVWIDAVADDGTLEIVSR